MKFIGIITVLLTMASLASAAITAAPEIDGSSAVSAVALIGGGLLIARSRRKK